MRPSQPCSPSFAHSSGVIPSGVPMSVLTTVDEHSLSKNFRAVLRSSSCSSLNPKFMRLAFWKAKHTLADDVALDLGGAALDGVGAGAEEGVLPEPLGDRPRAALHDLRVRSLDLHGQLLQPLVALHPHHLAGGGLGAGQLTLEELGDGPGAGLLEDLGVDPELGQLLPHDGIARDRSAILRGVAG